MKRLVRLLSSIVTIALAFTMLLTATASAHESRKVGKYQVVVGFLTEPPIEGEKNGVDLRVTNTESNQPVEGLEKTLKVEIAYKGTTKAMELRPLFRDPGHYTADLIPTQPGQYAFRFSGDIEGLEVNESFQSGPGKFNDVQSSVDLQFPDKLPAMREVAGVTGANQQAAAEARDNASSAKALAVIGIALGAVGIMAGAGSAAVALRKKQ